ncbi:MAG TPA: polyphosphate kinase 1 [Cyclobacteriaceae bacterium]
MKDQPIYYDRDLSWLSFNYRVLMEARDKANPLYERIKFLAIYSSNLDEFFRVRVAGIRSLSRIDKEKINIQSEISEPKRLLKTIHTKVTEQLNEYGDALNEVFGELNAKGVCVLENSVYTEKQKEKILYFFKTKVLAFLKPYVFGKNAGEPFLNNRQLYLALTIQKKGSKEKEYAYLNVPSDKLPRFFQLPSENGTYYFTYLDDIIRAHLDFIFPDYEILECKSIKLNKDADLHIDDEFSGDLVEKIEKQIKKRNLGEPSRFLFDKTTSADLIDFLSEKFELFAEDKVPGGRYHNLNDYMKLPNPVGSDVEIQKLKPIKHQGLESKRSIFSVIEEKDQILHFPYHSYDYILQFFNQAAIDPFVKEINVTFYRMAEESFIGDALISAAQNGKKVMVFMELKARFDEENNLKWAARMNEAGITIIYSIPGLKVHAKVALIKKTCKDGSLKKFGFFGTGNLNENTARIYVDHALLTCHHEMTDELSSIFRFLYKRKDPVRFKHLMVSQFNILEGFYALIDNEISIAKQGRNARIIIKLNNIEEKNIIDKLYEASQAGVQIRMIIRGICCLRPGIKGLSENIYITRIVDRFLEHARIFVFHNNGDEKIYLGSADWMKRNLYRRVEVTFPIYNNEIKDQIKRILDYQINDTVKSVQLNQDLENIPIENTYNVRSQLAIYDYVKKLEGSNGMKT